MDKPLREAYEALEEEISKCLKEHRGNSSVVSTMLNVLLSWPDHPYDFGTLYGSEFDPETWCRERFVIAETVDLDKNLAYAKERALIEEVKAQLARGRKCQVMWNMALDARLSRDLTFFFETSFRSRYESA